MAKERYKNENPSVEITDDLINSEAIPEFTKFLFESFYNSFEDATDKAIIAEFIKSFVRRYINRELCSSNERIFRSKLYSGLERYRYYLVNANEEYNKLNEAEVALTRSVHRDRSHEDKSNSKGNNVSNFSNSGEVSSSGSTDSTSSTTSDLTSVVSYGSKVDNTNSGTTTVSGTTSSEGSSKTTASDTETNASRGINTDYPQSSVSLSLVVPKEEDSTWEYASTGSDNLSERGSSGNTTTEDKNSSTNGSDTTTNGQSSQTHSGEDIRDDESDSSTTGKVETNSSGTSKNSGENTLSTESDTGSSGSETEDILYTDDTLSQFERISRLLDYLSKNPYSPIFKVIDELEIYFISEYVDDEREGYIDPDTDILKYILVEEGGA